jgi:hypothetical protein
VDELDAQPPARAVWNPSESSFDGVPQVLRVPLIFDWAVQHLVPERTVGSFEILRPRKPSERIATRWWRDRLGATANLGHIPQYVHPSGRTCSNGDSTCRSYAIVTFAGRDLPQSATVAMSVGGLAFSVRFAPDPATHVYAIDLDRLWFWHNAPPSARRVIDARSVPGASVVTVRRSAGSRLY